MPKKKSMPTVIMLSMMYEPKCISYAANAKKPNQGIH